MHTGTKHKQIPFQVQAKYFIFKFDYMQHTIQAECTVECNDCDFQKMEDADLVMVAIFKYRHICKSYADLKSGEKVEKMFTQKRKK